MFDRQRSSLPHRGNHVVPRRRLAVVGDEAIAEGAINVGSIDDDVPARPRADAGGAHSRTRLKMSCGTMARGRVRTDLV